MTETWFQDTSTTFSLYNLHGYKLEHSSRTGRGGGVALYINENYTYLPRPDLSVFNEGVLETLFIELVTSCHTSFLIGVIYCPKGVSNNVMKNCLLS